MRFNRRDGREGRRNARVPAVCGSTRARAVIFLLCRSSVGPIESTMYLSSSLVMRLSLAGVSAMETNHTAHHIIATNPINESHGIAMRAYRVSLFRRQTIVNVYTRYVKRGRPTVVFGQPSAYRISDNRAHETAGESESPKAGALGGRCPSGPHGVDARIHDSLSKTQPL